ncbi:DUF72 domain-containing protein [Paracoccus sp. S-4012]|uniref:DUF72 domain-containing protein n=1 Tax=Paracoccus sp. S-4012 TaxID=2665648 RepID=UPI0012B00790|nr:DUF72 domain-containing protein [Paracoccus sp. S-4012]MRX49491.1 DUF72 domain-containing protein [Paracoccus sp. S-4012]
MTGRIRVGVGGWSYEPWRETFYPADVPKARELEWASRQFTTLEVNATFYRGQSRETFQRWHDAVPEDFVFALKGPRYSTNRKVLAEAGESVDRFCASGIAALGPKLGPINWQLAPTKRFDAEDFAAFLALLPPEAEGLPLRHAVELRHESFACVEAVEIARAAGVAIVLAGDSEYPVIADATAGFVYARIMGTQEGEAAGYSDAALDAWAARARDWAAGKSGAGLEPLTAWQRKPRDVFLYVISGFKALNPLAARGLLSRL